ncbi:MarR family transcriptional regulator [Thioclava sp. SK-1]|uniref:MarR family winged helix-turn-helix transcriptional regulator n=1 Tax=Thioclava sp. SK-1 TaxID=1889770 RepID=UPI0008241BAA|nr:MarR family transcriptional regulator [Thioclava sp. SK-1]OCX67345.1 MarR family transcriptional regulator [Thioclava sp. SK-1]
MTSLSTQTDDKLRQFIGYNMKRTFLLVQEDMNRSLEPLGLRMASFSALAIIAENSDISQTRLAEMLCIERSGVVVLVDQLENADLIARHRVEGDRRSYALRLTDEGQRVWTQAEAAVQAHEDAFFADLTGPQRDALAAALRRLGGG